MLDCLAGLAQLQLENGQLESAYGLALVVLGHPATIFETSRSAGRIKAAAEERLTAGQLRRAEGRAAQLPLQAAAGTLLAS